MCKTLQHQLYSHVPGTSRQRDFTQNLRKLIILPVRHIPTRMGIKTGCNRISSHFVNKNVAWPRTRVLRRKIMRKKDDCAARCAARCATRVRELISRARFSKYPIYQTLSWDGAMRENSDRVQRERVSKVFSRVPCGGRGEASFGAVKLMYTKGTV